MATKPATDGSATLLLVPDVAWLYQALREGLNLTRTVRAPSGIEYDTGPLDAQRGIWNVMLAADTVSDGATLVADVNPEMLVILSGHDAGVVSANQHRVLFTLHPGTTTSQGRRVVHVPLPVALERQANRLVLRDELSVRTNNARFSLAAEGCAAPSRFASVLPAFERAKRPHVAVIKVTRHFQDVSQQLHPVERLLHPGPYLGTPLFEDLSGATSAFFHTLFEGLSPEVFAVPSSANPPSTPPSTDRVAAIPGALAGFELRGVRMFERVAWRPVGELPGWHVVLGDNASGKTSLLRALALTLLPRIERDALRQDWRSWLRDGAPRGHIEASIAQNAGPPHTLSLALDRVGSNGGSAVDVRSSETHQYSGFLASYGPFRRFTGGDPEWLSTFRAHPRTQRVITLFEERAALSDALEWLKDLWVRAETVKPRPPEARFLVQLLAFINDTGFLPPGVTLLRPDADGVWCRDGNNRRVLVIELSDGYRAALSLTLDLLRHLAVECGPSAVFAKSKALTVAADGIVLIDEPDAHLHPTWQQRIGGWFKRFFPRMQFLVTTHSPIVCQAADSVLLLPAPGDDGAAHMATPAELDRLRYGDVLDAFATDFFGRRVTRSEAGREKMARLAALNQKALRSGLDDVERAEQEQLRARLGTIGEDPSPPSTP